MKKGYWYPTDQNWFEFLSGADDCAEVNYWQPNGWSSIGRLERGAPFFFKLKAPHNHIGGFGFLDRHAEATAQTAWEAFGPANGAADFDTMVRRIEKYRRIRAHDPSGPYRIGCIMVQVPVFFPRESWIPAPSSWDPHGRIKGMQVDLQNEENDWVLRQCLALARRLERTPLRPRVPIAADGTDAVLRAIIPRKGQGPFRMALLDAYGQACAVTEEHSEPVLDAAHIRPYAEDRTYELSNGLLLRTDIHRLFEKGFVTVTPDHRFLVSPRLKALWDNGRTYYELATRVGRIRLPKDEADWPDREALEWHSSQRFLA